MKCSIKGCAGEYELKTIIHTVQHGSEVCVIENVPAEVCSICGDTLLNPDTVQHLERLIKQQAIPRKTAPLYEYA